MKTLDFPKIRQDFDYDCGAKVTQAMLLYYGIQERADLIMKYAKTTEEKGTPITGIVKTLKKYGLKAESKEMTIKDVKKLLDKKIPVIILLQAWSEKKNLNWDKAWDDGHYSVAIGYTKDRIIFSDPSSFFHTYLKFEELEKRWHDAIKNKKYYNIGIFVLGKKSKFNRDKLVHMD